LKPTSPSAATFMKRSIGLDIICAGKGKNNPLKFDAVPAEYEAEARARNMNARMLVEFVDGSKTMIEMVAIANCTGLVPDVPGMHGPAATRDELASVLVPKADGGVLSKAGCVDYSIGKGVAPGVFCIVGTDHPRVLERLIDLKVGKGPYFTLFRPYHLTRSHHGRQARSQAGRDAGQDRRDRIPRLGHDPRRGAQRQCRAAGSCRGRQGHQAGQGRRVPDL